MITCKPFNTSTRQDFLGLYEARFPGADASIPEVVLSNPFHMNAYDQGSLAYDEMDKVVAIHGLMSRRLYFEKTELKATSGVALAVAKHTNRDFLTGFLRDSVQASGADIFFANTSVPGSRKRGAAALGMVDGPRSCAEIRERTLRGNGMVARLLRKLTKIAIGRTGCRNSTRSLIAPYRTEMQGFSVACEHEIAETDFNRFWVSYLATNEGLVSSRTAEELRWLFGKGLASGEIVLLTARKNDALQGYVFCRRTDETATCWRVVDMIALKNDETILEALIEGTTQFLCARTPALCLQITGYPTWVQPLLKRLFPASSSFGFNKCVWTYLNEQTRVLCGDWVNAKTGWYGSPYDGDMCLM